MKVWCLTDNSIQTEILSVLKCGLEILKSQRALKALRDCNFYYSQLLDTSWHDSANLNKRSNHLIVWVPRHYDILGNEIADSLARDGSNTPFYGPEPIIKVSSLVMWSYITMHREGVSFPHLRDALVHLISLLSADVLLDVSLVTYGTFHPEKASIYNRDLELPSLR